MMYQVVDLAHGFPLNKCDTAYEAQAIAFKLAQQQALVGNSRVHLSVVGIAGKQVMEINIRQH